MSSLLKVDSFNAHVIGVGTGRASWALPPLFFAKESFVLQYLSL